VLVLLLLLLLNLAGSLDSAGWVTAAAAQGTRWSNLSLLLLLLVPRSLG
jgi:hypothetical protein